MHFTMSSFCLFHITNGVIYPSLVESRRQISSLDCLEGAANEKRRVPRKKSRS